jgi:hypothetical protein
LHCEDNAYEQGLFHWQIIPGKSLDDCCGVATPERIRRVFLKCGDYPT